MTYEIGDLAHLTVQFTDAINNLPADPSVVTITVTAPDGTVTVPGNTRTGVGAYSYDLPVTQVGLYAYKWLGTGSVQAAKSSEILVRRSGLYGPSPIDIVSVEEVKQWIPACTLTDLANIQICITSASAYWLWALGKDNQDGSIPTQSPLVQPVSFDDRYDGNGGTRQFVRETPIRSISLLTVDGVTINAAVGDTANGYVIDQSKKSIALRGGTTGRPYGSYRVGFGTCGGRFTTGIQNVHIQYIAGYSQTPADIVEKVIEMVTLNYKRRSWVDLKSQSKPETLGQMVFRDWEFPPGIRAVIDNYSRRAIV